MRKKWIHESFEDLPPETGYRFCNCLGIWFMFECLPFNMSLKVSLSLRTVLHFFLFPVFSLPKWKFNVWRKRPLFLYWSWETIYFCFREHRCLGWTLLRSTRRLCQPRRRATGWFTRWVLFLVLVPASSRGSARGLFFSQCDVWGKQSARLIQREQEGGVGGTLSSR